MKTHKSFKTSAMYIFLIGAFALIHTSFATPVTLPGWSASLSFEVNTTVTGANVATNVNRFPVLVRLDSTYFNFAEAQDSGQDLRFTIGAATDELPYEIESWDALKGQASVWVRMDVPGNAVTTLVMHWGNATATPMSNGLTVFESGYGFNGVWHLESTLEDQTSYANTGKNDGSEVVPGLIGEGRYFPGIKNVIKLGTDPNLRPASSLTMSAWIKTTVTADSLMVSILRNDGYYNALHVRGDNAKAHSSAFTATGVARTIYSWNDLFNNDQWHHFASTYTSLDGMKIYRDGELYDSNPNITGLLNVDSALGGLSLGGTGGGTEAYEGYMDEFRVSVVPRSAEWIKLGYQNQKPGQTLVSLPVDPGCTDNFGVSATTINIGEMEQYSVLGSPGCARQFYWAKVDTGVATPIFTSGLALTANSGRVSENSSTVYRFYAGQGTDWQMSQDVTVNITNNIPDPVFTLTGPTGTWNGQDEFVLKPAISNLAEILASPSPDLTYDWNITGMTLYNIPKEDSIRIRRAYEDGEANIELCLDNGGTPVCNSVTISVEIVGIATTAVAHKNFISINNGILEWKQSANIKIWSVDGTLVFDQNGDAGKTLELSPALKNISRGTLKMVITPLAGR